MSTEELKCPKCNSKFDEWNRPTTNPLYEGFCSNKDCGFGFTYYERLENWHNHLTQEEVNDIGNRITFYNRKWKTIL